MRKNIFSQVLITTLAMTACASPTPVGPTQPSPSDQVATLVAATMQAIPTDTPSPTPQPADESILVAFVKNGDIHVWESTTQLSELVFNADDANLVTISGDGQLIAFIRWWIDSNQCEHTALWVVDRDGENAREIVSPAQLRESLGIAECQVPTALIHQIEWLPGTHHLVYSLIPGWPHASPQGIYEADADTLSTSTLVPAEYSLKFVPSPDGSQIALMSATSLGFISKDGWRQDVLTYPKKGVPLPITPNGVWAQDGRAFLIAAPSEGESAFALNFSIMRVPPDGSEARPLAAITNSEINSITFSPDGKSIAFIDSSYRGRDRFDRRWVILPLAGDGEPLAISYHTDFGEGANVHWSPAGAPYAVSSVANDGNLSQLCPDAAQSSDICDSITPGYVTFLTIQWFDGTHFLFRAINPNVLFLGSVDHKTVHVVTWSLEDNVSFSAVKVAPNQ